MIDNTRVNDIQDKILQAVGILNAKAIESISYDKTFVCTIEDNTDKKQGKYQVYDGSRTFTAYSTLTNLANGTSVYVTIPNGNMEEQKIIIGKKTSENDKPFVFTTPFDTFFDMTGNVYKESQKAHGILANGNNTNLLIKEIDNINLTGYNRLGIKADFLTRFNSEVIQGQYGINILLTTDIPNSDNNSIEGEYSFSIDSSQMYGNPYKFDGYYSQEQVFDISNIGNIKKIQINFYQISGSFRNKNGELINILPEGVDAEIPENIYFNDIFINDIYLGFGYDLQSIHGDILELYTSESSTYSLDLNESISEQTKKLYLIIKKEQEIESTQDEEKKAQLKVELDALKEEFKNLIGENTIEELQNILEEDLKKYSSLTLKELEEYIKTNKTNRNEKQISVRWAHDLGEEQIVDIVGGSNNKLEYDICWYQFKMGEPAADHYSGPFWKKIKWYRAALNNENKIEYYNVNLESEEINTIETEYPKKEDLFNYSFVPDTNLQQERIKVIVIVKNSSIYRSKELIFTNNEEVPNQATINYTNALEIITTDGTNGNYYIYGQNNSIKETEHGKTIRTLKVKFDADNDGSRESEVHDNLTWYVPIKNTMLDFSQYLPPDNQSEENFIKVENLDSVNYKIKNYYNHSDDYNNLVICEYTFKNRVFRAEKRFDFGAAGTMGSEYTLVIDFAGEKDYVDYDNKTYIKDKDNNIIGNYHTIEMKVSMYDAQNNNIEIKKVDQWSWYYNNGYYQDPVAASYEFKQDGYLPIFYAEANELGVPPEGTVLSPKGNKITIANRFNINGLYILQATVGELTTYFPIPIKQDGKALVKIGNITEDNYFNNSEKILGKIKTDQLKYSPIELNKYNYKKNEYYIKEKEEYKISEGDYNKYETYYEKLSDIIIYQTPTKEIGFTGYEGYYFQLPIKYSENKNIMNISGPSQIFYSSDGNINYLKIPYNILNEQGDKIQSIDFKEDYENFIIADNQYFPIKWRIIVARKIVLKDNTIVYQNYYLDTNSNTLRPLNNLSDDNIKSKEEVFQYLPILKKENEEDYKLEPLGLYVKDAPVYGVQAYIDTDEINVGNAVLWTQPILVMQNNYPSTTINRWNGKSIEIDEETGTVLANAIGVGKKNNDNTFSGIMLGDWKNTDTENNITQQTGVYGFDHGSMTYALTEDGKAFFGKAGGGRIYIDGNEATLNSEQWKINGNGMQIDLDKPSITMRNIKLLEEGENLDSKTLLFNASEEKYPFKLGSKLKATWDGILEAQDVKITGAINATEGQIGNWQIKNGNIIGVPYLENGQEVNPTITLGESNSSASIKICSSALNEFAEGFVVEDYQPKAHYFHVPIYVSMKEIMELDSERKTIKKNIVEKEELIQDNKDNYEYIEILKKELEDLKQQLKSIQKEMEVVAQEHKYLNLLENLEWIENTNKPGPVNSLYIYDPVNLYERVYGNSEFGYKTYFDHYQKIETWYDDLKIRTDGKVQKYTQTPLGEVLSLVKTNNLSICVFAKTFAANIDRTIINQMDGKYYYYSERKKQFYPATYSSKYEEILYEFEDTSKLPSFKKGPQLFLGKNSALVGRNLFIDGGLYIYNQSLTIETQDKELKFDKEPLGIVGYVEKDAGDGKPAPGIGLSTQSEWGMVDVDSLKYYKEIGNFVIKVTKEHIGLAFKIDDEETDMPRQKRLFHNAYISINNSGQITIEADKMIQIKAPKVEINGTSY